MMFRDRGDAGELLARRLDRYRDRDPVVLGLANGGIPIASQVAQRLGARLDVIIVRKIRAEGEGALGAVAEHGARFINADAVRDHGLRASDVSALAERELREIDRLVELYRGGASLPDLRHRTVLVVDDWVATGATARAACSLVRTLGAAHVALAAPVVAGVLEPELHASFDDVVALDRPLHLGAIAEHYRDFARVTEREALRTLGRAEPDERSDPLFGPVRDDARESAAAPEPHAP